MLKQALFLLVLVFYLMLSVLADSAANSNIYVQCSEHYFTSMTPYESNVNSLFTSIIDSSSMYNFNKFKISPPEYSQNDAVYGLFQCRGDLSSPNCKDCVTNSISQLKTNCPSSTGGGIQLDGCFVKYDNSSFFGAVDNIEVVKTCGHSIGYNSDVLNRIDGALEYLIAGSGQYFYEGNYGSIEGKAQCVQDLSVSDCQDCLKEACGRLRSECVTSAWGNMYLGKCYLIYVDEGNDSHGYNSSSNISSGGVKISGIKKKGVVIIGAVLAVAGGALTLHLLKVNVKDCCNTNIFNDTKKEEAEKKKKEEAEKKKKEESAAAEKKKKEEAEKKKKEEAEKKEKEKKAQGCPYPPPQYCPYPPPQYCPNPPPTCYVVQPQEGCTIM